MKSRTFLIAELIIIVLIITAVLPLSFQQFLSAQRIKSHHPGYAKGTLVKTDDPFDIAISGRGYFRLIRDDGKEVYTRHSEMTLDETGRFSSIYGFPLADHIVLPQELVHIEISPQGIVNVAQTPGFQIAMVGQVQLVDFINPDGLAMDENGCYVETERSGPPVLGNPMQNQMGQLLQGYQLLAEFDEDTPEHLIINGEYYNGFDDRFQTGLIKTDKPMDFAIDGPGWAEVTLPNGMSGFTRLLRVMHDETARPNIPYGRTQASMNSIPLDLKIENTNKDVEEIEAETALTRSDPAGFIQERTTGNQNTNPVAVVEQSPVQVSQPAEEVDWDAVWKETLNHYTPEELANRIKLYRFSAAENLHYFGKGIYVETDASGPPIPVEQRTEYGGTIKSGYLNDVPRSEP